MNTAFVFNPGSNSLKFEWVELRHGQGAAGEAKKLASAVLDNIGRQATLSVYMGREVVSEEQAEAADTSTAATVALGWLTGRMRQAGYPGHARPLVGLRSSGEGGPPGEELAGSM